MTPNTPTTPAADVPVVTPDMVNLLGDAEAGGCCGGGSCSV